MRKQRHQLRNVPGMPFAVIDQGEDGGQIAVLGHMDLGWRSGLQQIEYEISGIGQFSYSIC